MGYKKVFLDDGSTVKCLGARGENVFLGVILPIFCQALAAQGVGVRKSLVNKKDAPCEKCLRPGGPQPFPLYAGASGLQKGLSEPF